MRILDSFSPNDHGDTTNFALCSAPSRHRPRTAANRLADHRRRPRPMVGPAVFTCDPQPRSALSQTSRSRGGRALAEVVIVGVREVRKAKPTAGGGNDPFREHVWGSGRTSFGFRGRVFTSASASLGFRRGVFTSAIANIHFRGTVSMSASDGIWIRRAGLLSATDEFALRESSSVSARPVRPPATAAETQKVRSLGERTFV